MELRLGDLRWREVIDTATGARLGYVNDILMEAETGRVLALIVPGPYRFFGLFGRGEEFYIPWECIKQIGDDIILIDKPVERRPPQQEAKRRKRMF